MGVFLITIDSPLLDLELFLQQLQLQERALGMEAALALENEARVVNVETERVFRKTTVSSRSNTTNNNLNGLRKSHPSSITARCLLSNRYCEVWAGKRATIVLAVI